jgi:hypothetical protein
MKTIIITAIAVILSSISFVSCNDAEDSTCDPVVLVKEVALWGNEHILPHLCVASGHIVYDSIAAQNVLLADSIDNISVKNLNDMASYPMIFLDTPEFMESRYIDARIENYQFYAEPKDLIQIGGKSYVNTHSSNGLFGVKIQFPIEEGPCDTEQYANNPI